MKITARSEQKNKIVVRNPNLSNVYLSYYKLTPPHLDELKDVLCNIT